MTVYVDDLRVSPSSRALSCRATADSVRELSEALIAAGVDYRRMMTPARGVCLVIVTPQERSALVKNGARETTRVRLDRHVRRNRK